MHWRVVYYAGMALLAYAATFAFGIWVLHIPWWYIVVVMVVSAITPSVAKRVRGV